MLPFRRGVQPPLRPRPRRKRPIVPTPTYEIVVVGTSLGGLRALKQLMAGLSSTFPVPMAIVQHVPERSGGDLSGLLERYSPLPVCEPNDKQAIEPGIVYIAPVGYHLLVEEKGRFALSTDPPVLFARPSIDVLFESAAIAYGSGVVAVGLTSSSEDGVAGMAAVKARGGQVIIQDPATAEGRTLPDAALAANLADMVLPLAKMGPYLDSLTSPRGARMRL